MDLGLKIIVLHILNRQRNKEACSFAYPSTRRQGVTTKKLFELSYSTHLKMTQA
jgi:hypothetical protein